MNAAYEALKAAGNPNPWQALFQVGRNLEILDLGSNDGRTLRGLDHSRMTVVEPYAPSVEQLKKQGFREVFQADARQFVPEVVALGRKWDYVMCMDVVEHMPKEDSLALIQEMKKLALRGVILFIPVETPELHQDPEFQRYREWGLSQHPDGQRKLMEHLSFWSPEEFKSLGFVTVTIKDFHRPGLDAFWAVWYADAADRQTAIATVEAFLADVLGKEKPAFDQPLRVINQDHMRFGRGVTFATGAWVECVTSYMHKKYSPELIVGDGVSAEFFVHIACAGKVEIGRHTMIGSHVLITDHDHGMEDPTLPPRYQDLTVKAVSIGEGCWIGDGAKILKGVALGRGCVVGANAVVTSGDYAPGTILAGAPAGCVSRRPHAGVNVVIVSCGDVGRLRRCLDALDQTEKTLLPMLRTIVVVNGNRNPGIIEWLEAHRSVDKTIYNEENIGFGAGVNSALVWVRKQHVTGGYVAVLNDDVVVTSGWLQGLLDAMDQHPRAAIVGPVTDNVSGVQQVGKSYSGGEMSRAAYPTQRLVAFCWLMRMGYMEHVGDFDPRFGIGNFEDDDLCLRVLQHGYELYVVPTSFVSHEGHATFEELGIDLEQSLRENWEKYKEKWGIPAEVEFGQGFTLEVPPAPLRE
jgi:acetyltransferase-like isoleucine patch superfamily enzyme/GT2 family glycosyltransferase